MQCRSIGSAILHHSTTPSLLSLTALRLLLAPRECPQRLGEASGDGLRLFGRSVLKSEAAFLSFSGLWPAPRAYFAWIRRWRIAVSSACRAAAICKGLRSACASSFSSEITRMDWMLVFVSPSVKSFVMSRSSELRKKVIPQCFLQALRPHTSLRPLKQSMCHLIASVRSGSQR